MNLTDGDAWREHAVEELAPLWHEHAPDGEHGAFHQALTREWEPAAPYDKIPAMMSRYAFAFSTAYMLSGEESYLDQARRGADYVLEYGWDEEYGGWYDRLTREGEPAETTKSVQFQLYTNVGLVQYYFATGDEQALDRVRDSLRIRHSHGHDDEYGGYYQALDRDLSVLDDGKNKHAHHGYVGSLTLNLYLATRHPDLLAWQRELCDLSIERQMEDGWIYGLNSEFDRRWNRTPNVRDGREVVSIGAQLTAALAFLRLFQQSGEKRFLDAGARIAENVDRHGYDERGFFWDYLHEDTLEPTDDAMVNFWIQNYGCFLQLQLYNLTESAEVLDRFRDAAAFYLEQMVDEEHGGIVPAVDVEGEPTGNMGKAAPWDTPYHEIEHGFLCSLYLDLYVNGETATLHFRLDGGDDGRIHYVCPVDDPRVEVEAVTIDGEEWPAFDAKACSVSVPPGAHDVAVTLAPVPGR